MLRMYGKGVGVVCALSRGQCSVVCEGNNAGLVVELAVLVAVKVGRNLVDHDAHGSMTIDCV